MKTTTQLQDEIRLQKDIIKRQVMIIEEFSSIIEKIKKLVNRKTY